MFSVIATCQRHQVEPLADLRDVRTRIAAKPVRQLETLLPGCLQHQKSFATGGLDAAATTFGANLAYESEHLGLLWVGPIRPHRQLVLP
jgi:hypothetical protein